MGNLSANFDLWEFRQRNPTVPVPTHLVPNVQLLVTKQLQPLRDVVGPILIRSGYRSQEKNDSLPGAASKSQHLTATAADFTVPGISNEDVYCTILRLIKEGKIDQGGLGWYGPGGHIHLDKRGFKARWNKSNTLVPACISIPPVGGELTMSQYEELMKAIGGTNKLLAAVAGLVKANADLGIQHSNQIDFLISAIVSHHSNEGMHTQADLTSPADPGVIKKIQDDVAGVKAALISAAEALSEVMPVVPIEDEG